MNSIARRMIALEEGLELEDATWQHTLFTMEEVAQRAKMLGAQVPPSATQQLIVTLRGVRGGQTKQFVCGAFVHHGDLSTATSAVLSGLWSKVVEFIVDRENAAPPIKISADEQQKLDTLGHALRDQIGK